MGFEPSVFWHLFSKFTFSTRLIGLYIQACFGLNHLLSLWFHMHVLILEWYVLCRYSLLTLASEAICHLIYPFRWQVSFVPMSEMSLQLYWTISSFFLVGALNVLYARWQNHIVIEKYLLNYQSSYEIFHCIAIWWRFVCVLKHVYIPLLFFSGVDYIDAPTPYMMGLHSGVDTTGLSMDGVSVLNLPIR